MDLNDLWTAFLYGLLPALSFVAVVSVTVSFAARYLGKVRVTGQSVLIASFALLGGILGVSTGNSREPVVSGLLSFLLALITLLLGYVFEKGSKSVPLIPFCMLALMITAFYGLFVGSVVRGKNERYEREVARNLLYEQQVTWPIEKSEKLGAEADQSPNETGAAE